MSEKHECPILFESYAAANGKIYGPLCGAHWVRRPNGDWVKQPAT